MDVDQAIRKIRATARASSQPKRDAKKSKKEGASRP
jgi:hypothetical protein